MKEKGKVEGKEEEKQLLLKQKEKEKGEEKSSSSNSSYSRRRMMKMIISHERIHELLEEVFRRNAHEDIVYTKESRIGMLLTTLIEEYNSHSHSSSGSSGSHQDQYPLPPLPHHHYYFLYRSIGDNDGQMADYRITPSFFSSSSPSPYTPTTPITPTTTMTARRREEQGEGEGKGEEKDLPSIHIKVYQTYYKVHWDYVDPSKNPFLHLLLDAPHWLERGISLFLRFATMMSS